MLSRNNRITTSEFPAAARGIVLHDGLFRVSIKKSTHSPVPRCAVIVSGKIAKTSVVRNLMRRRAYEALGLLLDRLPNAFIAVFPQKADYSVEEAEKSLEKLLCSKI